MFFGSPFSDTPGGNFIQHEKRRQGEDQREHPPQGGGIRFYFRLPRDQLMKQRALLRTGWCCVPAVTHVDAGSTASGEAVQSWSLVTTRGVRAGMRVVSS